MDQIDYQAFALRSPIPLATGHSPESSVDSAHSTKEGERWSWDPSFSGTILFWRQGLEKTSNNHTESPSYLPTFHQHEMPTLPSSLMNAGYLCCRWDGGIGAESRLSHGHLSSVSRIDIRRHLPFHSLLCFSTLMYTTIGLLYVP